MNELTRVKKQSSPPFDYSMKVMIIGDSGVGKSSLLHRYQQNKFTQNYIMTVGMNYIWKIEQVEKMRIKLQIWDTAGQQRYKTITQNYYKNSDGAIISFSIDSRDSFISVKNWIEQLTDTARGNIQILLVGTKCDLVDQREVDREEAEQFAKENSLPYAECSAKSGEEVNEVFYKLTAMMKHNIRFIKKQGEYQTQRSQSNAKKLLSMKEMIFSNFKLTHPNIQMGGSAVQIILD